MEVEKNIDMEENKDTECGSDFKEEQPLIQQGQNYKLLPAEHPLLEKFQKLLREHLENTKSKLIDEIGELKHQIKLKDNLREEHGSKLFDLQQELHSQNAQLEQYALQIHDCHIERTHIEKMNTESKEEYEKKITIVRQQNALNTRRMMELENMQTLEGNIRKWADEVEDEVKNAKRVVSKDVQLQKQLSEEKKKSDLLFYHLDMEVKKNEKELKIVHDELLDMRGAIDLLKNSISDANADLECLQSEHKRLTQAWSDVIIAIQHRDKICFQVFSAVSVEEEKIRLNICGMQAIKKQIKRELMQSEKLEIFKSRLANDFVNLKRECQKQTDILTTLQAKLQQIPEWMEQTAINLQEAQREGNNLENDIRRLQWKLDKQYSKKYELEEQILKIAQDQLVADKASEYRVKLLNKAREQRRNLEQAMAQSQNQLATNLLELEKNKGYVYKLQQENEKYKEKLFKVEQRSDFMNTELKELEKQINLKGKMMDKLSSQLDVLLQSDDSSGKSPTELKIKLQEKTIYDGEQQIRAYQQFWVMLQNHFVNLSQKRNSQLNEIHVTRKQLLIVKQKTLQVDQSLLKAEDSARDLKRDIQLYTTKLELLNKRVFTKKQFHELEENECELEHSNLIERLKESEMKILEMEADVNDLSRDIDHYKDLVLDKHRESLSWETKYKLIEETLQWYKTEKKQDSKIGIMKAEIHRMEIRYSQLRRAQERLTQDLAHCVLHRAQIVEADAINQHTKQKTPTSKENSTIQQRIVEVQNKLKHTQNEINGLTTKKLIDLTEERDVLAYDIKYLSDNLEKELLVDESIRKEIEAGILLKHYNLEKIIRKQNRAKSYRKLANVSMPIKLSRSESTVEVQTQKQSEINEVLMDILTSLMLEFPDRKPFLIKLSQILKD